MKQLWDKLAKENSKYYINSDKGKGITEEEFIESGDNDCVKYVFSDELLPIDGVFLEIGCGNGRMTWFLANSYNVLGIDISGVMIKEARKRVSGVYFAETDGSTIPFDNNSIDVAFSYIVFQHMKDKKMVESNLREVYRVLKPEGIFKVRIRTDKVNLRHWWGGVNYSEAEITKICEDIGYKVIKTEPVKDYGLWLWLKKN